MWSCFTHIGVLANATEFIHCDQIILVSSTGRDWGTYGNTGAVCHLPKTKIYPGALFAKKKKKKPFKWFILGITKSVPDYVDRNRVYL